MSVFLSAFGATEAAGAGLIGSFVGVALGAGFWGSAFFFVLVGAGLGVFSASEVDLAGTDRSVDIFRLLAFEDFGRRAVLDLPRMGLKADGT